MASRKLRLGMVGGGPGAFIGAVHRTAARIDDRWELVAAALSSDPVKAKSFGEEIHVPRVYASYAEMAAAEAKHPEPIDAVAIVTPNHTHADIAMTFLKAGFHVMCDKPMTTTLADAEALAAEVDRTGLVFGLTHTYAGYPMVRQMKQMIAEGALGKIRMINVHYAQGWLTTAVEKTGAKQAEWRTDPAKSGPAGSLGDIGTHAYHLAYFTTSLKAESVAADVTTFVPGRRLDDNVQAMLRFEDGTKANLWASQIAAGVENDLSISIHGEKGSFLWSQENPNYVQHLPLNEPPRLLTRGGPAMTPFAAQSARIPSGHPEGYFEAMAQLYRDMAELITARNEGFTPSANAQLLPNVHDGVRGLRFIDAVLKSSKDGSAWTKI